jgi:hypothetical protein
MEKLQINYYIRIFHKCVQEQDRENQEPENNVRIMYSGKLEKQL